MLTMGYTLSIVSTAVILLGSSRLKTDTYGLVINAALKYEASCFNYTALLYNLPG